MRKEDHWLNRSNVKEFVAKYRRCWVCGGTVDMAPHHRHPKKRPEGYDGDIHESKNLAAVCWSCHSRWDSMMGQAISRSISKREANCENLQRLRLRFPGNWLTMAPEWLVQSFLDRREQ